MANDYKIDNPEFWYDALDDFQMDDEIVVVEINEEHLLSQDINGLQEKGSVDFGDWTGLSSLLNEEESKTHKSDFNDDDTEWIVFLYTSGRYVTCISG